MEWKTTFAQHPLYYDWAQSVTDTDKQAPAEEVARLREAADRFSLLTTTDMPLSIATWADIHQRIDEFRCQYDFDHHSNFKAMEPGSPEVYSLGYEFITRLLRTDIMQSREPHMVLFKLVAKKFTAGALELYRMTAIDGPLEQGTSLAAAIALENPVQDIFFETVVHEVEVFRTLLELMPRSSDQLFAHAKWFAKHIIGRTVVDGNPTYFVRTGAMKLFNAAAHGMIDKHPSTAGLLDDTLHGIERFSVGKPLDEGDSIMTARFHIDHKTMDLARSMWNSWGAIHRSLVRRQAR